MIMMMSMLQAKGLLLHMDHVMSSMRQQSSDDDNDDVMMMTMVMMMIDDDDDEYTMPQVSSRC